MLGLCCCASFSLVEARRGYSLVEVCGFHVAVASLVSEHRLQGTRASAAVARGLSSCGSRAVEHRLSSRGAWA